MMLSCCRHFLTLQKLACVCSYVSEQLQNADVSRILGVEVHNPRQQVWHQGSTVTPVPSLNADTLGSSLLVAKNVAELR